jgi:ABC-type glycerol-3-phosphate transport system substrate-binding protein
VTLTRSAAAFGAAARPACRGGGGVWLEQQWQLIELGSTQQDRRMADGCVGAFPGHLDEGSRRSVPPEVPSVRQDQGGRGLDPWTSRTTDWTNALTSGKGGPDITELGNTGQTELGAPGATSGGSDEDFALGKLDMYIDGPWAQAQLTQVSKKFESQWASFPIPSQSGPNPAPAFSGGSDLGVWVKSKYPQADWDLISLMDSPSNATTFANAAGFFPQFTSKLQGGAYAGNPVLAGFAKAAAYTQISPLNSKNWAAADAQDAIIPAMMKALMQGADLTATVNKANTQ